MRVEYKQYSPAYKQKQKDTYPFTASFFVSLRGLQVTSETDYSWFITLYKAAVFPNLTLPSGTLTVGERMEKADVPSTRGNSRWPIERKNATA